MTTCVYDDTPQAWQQLPAWVAARVTVVCPKCGAELIIALTAEEAERPKVHPGIYCPADLKHLTITIELKSERISAMRRKWRATGQRERKS